VRRQSRSRYRLRAEGAAVDSPGWSEAEPWAVRHARSLEHGSPKGADAWATRVPLRSTLGYRRPAPLGPVVPRRRGAADAASGNPHTFGDLVGVDWLKRAQSRTFFNGQVLTTRSGVIQARRAVSSPNSMFWSMAGLCAAWLMLSRQPSSAARRAWMSFRSRRAGLALISSGARSVPPGDDSTSQSESAGPGAMICGRDGGAD